MTADLRPYPEYRDSGVPWLGKVPKHWRITSLRRVAHVQLSNVDKHTVEGEREVCLCNYTDVYYHRHILPNMDFMRATALPREVQKFELQQGDVLITKDSEDWQDIAVPAVVTQDMPGVLCGYHLAHVRPDVDELCGQYLMWACYSETVAQQFRVAANGVTRYGISDPDIKASVIPLPPVREQQVIGRYLRHFDRQVRRFIRNRRRVIEVLNEQKQAIINRAVTRGLDPTAPLKPSNIDWLGDVPKHWARVPLRYLAEVQTGITLGKNYNGEDVEERPYLRVANVQAGHIDLRVVKTIAVPPSEILGSELRAGDVLMTEGGDIDKLGRGCVWRGEIRGCLHQNHIFAVRAKQSRLLPDYLVALMGSQHGRIYFELTAKQTTNLASTNSTTLRAFPVLLPSLEEQHSLLDRIARETREVDSLHDRTQREITLIREYRTRLIADVVTGKLDVRHLAPPEMLSEDEVGDALLDEADGFGDDDAVEDGGEPMLVEHDDGSWGNDG